MNAYGRTEFVGGMDILLNRMLGPASGAPEGQMPVPASAPRFGSAARKSIDSMSTINPAMLAPPGQAKVFRNGATAALWVGSCAVTAQMPFSAAICLVGCTV